MPPKNGNHLLFKPMEFQSRDRIQPPFEEMYRIAKQYARRQAEADDLVQDLLLEAVRTEKDFTDARFMAWGRGFLRNRAAFIARTEGRRRKREAVYHNTEADVEYFRLQLPDTLIVGLRPSLRILARLINCGLDRKEMLYILNLTDTALRQRLVALRREWKTYCDRTGEQHPEPQDKPDHLLSSGLIRRSLIQAFRHNTNRTQHLSGRIIGSHDPDGHLFAIRTFLAHKKHVGGNTSKDKGK